MNTSGFGWRNRFRSGLASQASSRPPSVKFGTAAGAGANALESLVSQLRRLADIYARPTAGPSASRTADLTKQVDDLWRTYLAHYAPHDQVTSGELPLPRDVMATLLVALTLPFAESPLPSLHRAAGLLPACGPVPRPQFRLPVWDTAQEETADRLQTIFTLTAPLGGSSESPTTLRDSLLGVGQWPVNALQSHLIAKAALDSTAAKVRLDTATEAKSSVTLDATGQACALPSLGVSRISPQVAATRDRLRRLGLFSAHRVDAALISVLSCAAAKPDFATLDALHSACQPPASPSATLSFQRTDYELLIWSSCLRGRVVEARNYYQTMRRDTCCSEGPSETVYAALLFSCHHYHHAGSNQTDHVALYHRDLTAQHLPLTNTLVTELILAYSRVPDLLRLDALLDRALPNSTDAIPFTANQGYLLLTNFSFLGDAKRFKLVYARLALTLLAEEEFVQAVVRGVVRLKDVKLARHIERDLATGQAITTGNAVGRSADVQAALLFTFAHLGQTSDTRRYYDSLVATGGTTPITPDYRQLSPAGWDMVLRGVTKGLGVFEAVTALRLMLTERRSPTADLWAFLLKSALETRPTPAQQSPQQNALPTPNDHPPLLATAPTAGRPGLALADTLLRLLETAPATTWTSELYFQAIRARFYLGQPLDALALFDELKLRPCVEVNVALYTLVLHQLDRLAWVPEMAATMDEMTHTYRLKPTPAMYTRLLAHLQGNEVYGALEAKVRRDMVQDYARKADQLKDPPSPKKAYRHQVAFRP
ncbi:hypothetical protein IWQ60_007032 [Tieghemiomyces parasiticus]|uniref:Uncharacterized protein n=1 Tax=Tieghemiomyces parasiticus TaxID=78921 RepID=A0A9W8A079_9FUNG|nr:hypothetical protein IWQ60_007032 [Tieghemiomyces parasiticus]